MDNVRPVTVQSNKSNGLSSFMRWIGLILLLVLALFCWWKYFYTFSDGYRTGLVQKLSHKGNLFKTYEGELVLSSIASTNSVTLASEKFYFTVSNDSIAKLLQNFEGRQAKLHYEQKNGKLFWRGESEYIVDAVEPAVINK